MYKIKRRPLKDNNSIYIVEKDNKLFVAKKLDPNLENHEFNILNDLHHPRIVKQYGIQKIYYGSRELKDNYLILEKVFGVPIILKERPIPRESLIGYATDISSALSYINMKGIVHGDVSMGNVMAAKKRAKLLDFDIANRLEKEFCESRGINFRNSPLEAWVGFYHKKTDVYSFGVLLLDCHRNNLTINVDWFIGTQIHGLIDQNWKSARDFYNDALQGKEKAMDILPLQRPENVKSVIRRRTKMRSLLEGMLEWNLDNRPSIQEVEKELLTL
tara:strand:- start:3498 stop:4316 length:819 start_codon:yes stop_codon:yes gene_type:complete